MGRGVHSTTQGNRREIARCSLKQSGRFPYSQCGFLNYSDGHCLPKPMLTGSEMVKSASTSFQNHHHVFLLIW